MISIAIAFLSLSGPIPVDGSAIPLPPQAELKLEKVVCGPVWQSGVYDVEFQYKSPKAMNDLVRIFRERGIVVFAYDPAEGYLKARKECNGIIQEMSSNNFIQPPPDPGWAPAFLLLKPKP